MQLTEHAITIGNQSARYYSYIHDNEQSPKPTLHFYGGNGFAVGIYQPLLTHLSQYFNIISLAMAGYWYDTPTANKRTREQDAQVLIEFLDIIKPTLTHPVIGIGHSQGATSTALACAERPDLFDSLYLIEPVTFTASQVMIYKRLPRWLMFKNEPFKSVLSKQSQWQSVDMYYHHLRKQAMFKRVSDENLYIYADNSLISNANNDGYELLFSPQQELANYFGVPYVDEALQTINSHDNPTSYTLLIGKPSIFISEKVRKHWSKFVQNEHIITLSEYGHLLPVEAPELVAEHIIRQYNTHDL